MLKRETTANISSVSRFRSFFKSANIVYRIVVYLFERSSVALNETFKWILTPIFSSTGSNGVSCLVPKVCAVAHTHIIYPLTTFVQSPPHQ
jgi:hypothetical protein